MKLFDNKNFMEKFMYLVVGGLTTVVNYVVYWLVNENISGEYGYLIANGTAWAVAVAFAYIANKLFVFHSKTDERGKLLREIGSFVAARVASLLFDYGFMILAVEALGMNEYLAKILSNIVVVIINYIFSKKFIFKGTDNTNTASRTPEASRNAANTAQTSPDARDAYIARTSPDARDAGLHDTLFRGLVRHRFTLLSFLIPAAMLTLAFAILGMYPFGKNSILIIDNHHQYTPFIVELGRILRGGGSLLYSWSAGLGSNFIARVSYYLASPLNLLSVFVGDAGATEFTLFLVIFRVGCAGLTFSWYLRTKFRAQSFITVMFSAMYALCGFVLAYYWNLMWFDCIAVFPLVAMGLERLVGKGRGLLYCISLAYCVVSNYFIAIMICIYSVLYFIVYLIIRARRMTSSGVIKSIRNFAVYSLLGGALSAVITLPAYFGLLRSSAAGAKLPENIRIYSDVLDIIGNHLALVKPSIMTGLPNIYCGVIILLFVPLYFMNRYIRLREKICNGLLICFMLISFNINTLDFLWHGTHFPNSLFFRFAFLYVFLILTLSYHTVLKIRGVSQSEIFATFAIVTGFIFFMDAKPAEKTTDWTIYISFALLLAEMLIIILLRRSYKPGISEDAGFPEAVGAVKNAEFEDGSQSVRLNPGRLRRRAVVALTVVVCVEIVANAAYGIPEAGIFTKDSYLTHTNEVKPTVERIKAREATGGNGFERIEFAEHTTYNTPVVYDYKGISYYSSTSYVDVNDLFGKLGIIHSNAWYVYRSAPPTLNSMFAVKYLLSKENAINNGMYTEIKFNTRRIVVSEDGTQVTEGDEDGDGIPDKYTPSVHVYENPYFLPLGFMVKDDVTGWNLDEQNPFYVQEDFFALASGLSERLFNRLGARDVSLENMSITEEGGTDGTYRYRNTDSGSAAKAVYRVTADRDGPVYIYIKCPKVENVTVKNLTPTADGEEPGARSHDIKYPYIIDAQYTPNGGEIEIEINFDASSGDTFTLHAYSFDESAFQRSWSKLSLGGMEVKDYSDTHVTGEVFVSEPGLLFTSIPYDEGWSVKVDGEPVETETIGDGALLAVRLDRPGLNTVTFDYMTPGLGAGALITLAAAIALFVFQKLFNRR